MIHICCWKSSQINTVFNFPAGNTESQQYGDEIQQSTNINIFFLFYSASFNVNNTLLVLQFMLPVLELLLYV